MCDNSDDSDQETVDLSTGRPTAIGGHSPAVTTTAGIARGAPKSRAGKSCDVTDCLDDGEEDVSDLRAVARGPELKPPPPTWRSMPELAPRQRSDLSDAGSADSNASGQEAPTDYRDVARITMARPVRAHKVSMARGGWGDPE